MIKSVGVVSTYVSNNGKNKGERMFWDYDGNKINLDIQTDKNGKINEKYFELTNDDISDIINVPQHQIPLDKRLMNDFLSNISSPSVKHTNTKKRNSKKLKKSKKMRNKK